MAKKRYVNTVFWDDLYVQDLDPIEKLLFLYLITNPCTNISGVYQIHLRRIAMDTGIDKDMIMKIFGRLQEDGKIFYDNGWIVIRNFIKHQNINSQLVQRGIERELADVPPILKQYVYNIDQALKRH